MRFKEFIWKNNADPEKINNALQDAYNRTAMRFHTPNQDDSLHNWWWYGYGEDTKGKMTITDACHTEKEAFNNALDRSHIVYAHTERLRGHEDFTPLSKSEALRVIRTHFTRGVGMTEAAKRPQSKSPGVLNKIVQKFRR